MKGKKKVLITLALKGRNIELLAKEFEVIGNQNEVMNREEIKKYLPEVEAVISRTEDNFTKELFDCAPNLKLIVNCGVGYDSLDMKTATERGIIVCNTPNVVGNATADVALFLLLSIFRRMTEAEQHLRSGNWPKGHFPYLATDPEHKTLGIIGMGSIGQALARRVKPLEMKVVYHKRNRLDPTLEKKLNLHYLSLKDLLSSSDVVSFNIPLTSETKHLLNDEKITWMKDGAYVINTSRGGVIKESALVAALKSGKLKGAGLDVHEFEPKVAEELLTLPSVTLLPHMGTATVETRARMFLLCLENVKAFFETGKALTPVNVLPNNIIKTKM